MTKLTLQRKKFTLADDHIFLNGAYMAPLLKKVEAAGWKGLLRKRNPGTFQTDWFFDESQQLRALFGKLIKAPATQCAIIPSVSYGMANVTRNVKMRPGDEVIVAAGQFPSNVYPWMRLVRESRGKLTTVAPPPTRTNRGRIWNERLMEAITPRTRVVALGPVHWADGTRFDLRALRARTREVGALLVVDGTQAVGAFPFDVSAIQPDALVCAGYKWLMGPYSIGMAYYGPAFENGTPVEENWISRLHSEDFAALVNYQDSYQPGALRYEVGEHSNFILVPMMIAALQQVLEWQPGRIQSYCESIGRPAVSRLRQAGFWIEEEAWRAHHLFGIRLPDDRLWERVQGRLAKHKISVSFRGDAIRVSPGVYNTSRELNRLAEVLTMP